jgi:XisI protein
MERTVEKIKKYQEIVAQLLRDAASTYQNDDTEQLEDEVICDFLGNHFQLLTVGWRNNRYVFIVNCHIDIKPDAKIWIMANNTDMIIADALKQQGIPAHDIVLGLKSPVVRQYTGYAVA